MSRKASVRALLATEWPDFKESIMFSPEALRVPPRNTQASFDYIDLRYQAALEALMRAQETGLREAHNVRRASDSFFVLDSMSSAEIQSRVRENSVAVCEDESRQRYVRDGEALAATIRRQIQETIQRVRPQPTSEEVDRQTRELNRITGRDTARATAPAQEIDPLHRRTLPAYFNLSATQSLSDILPDPIPDSRFPIY